MKKLFKEIVDLYNLDNYDLNVVISVFKYNHYLEAALGATELSSFHAWLKEIANQGSEIPGLWDYYLDLWHFQGETIKYSETMSLRDAIRETIEEWCK